MAEHQINRFPVLSSLDTVSRIVIVMYHRLHLKPNDPIPNEEKKRGGVRRGGERIEPWGVSCGDRRRRRWSFWGACYWHPPPPGGGRSRRRTMTPPPPPPRGFRLPRRRSQPPSRRGIRRPPSGLSRAGLSLQLFGYGQKLQRIEQMIPSIGRRKELGNDKISAQVIGPKRPSYFDFTHTYFHLTST